MALDGIFMSFLRREIEETAEFAKVNQIGQPSKDELVLTLHHRERAVNYHADSQGTQIIYEAVSQAVCDVRACRPMSKQWRENVDADFQKRGK